MLCFVNHITVKCPGIGDARLMWIRLWIKKSRRTSAFLYTILIEQMLNEDARSSRLVEHGLHRVVNLGVGGQHGGQSSSSLPTCRSGRVKVVTAFLFALGDHGDDRPGYFLHGIDGTPPSGAASRTCGGCPCRQAPMGTGGRGPLRRWRCRRLISAGCLASPWRGKRCGAWLRSMDQPKTWRARSLTPDFGARRAVVSAKRPLN
jgi:hypothetical protein